MSASSIPNNKFTAPPTIANYARHQGWIQQLNNANVKLDLDPATVPLKLQAFTNTYSLRPSEVETSLQKEAQELPRSMMVGGPDEANFLCMLLEMMDAKVVVEVGVFRGVTTLAFAQCLQKLNSKNTDKKAERKVYGLDVSSEFAEIGQKYWKKAGVDDLIDFRVGDAKDSLSKLLTEDELGENSVDLCFIDADKSSYDDYYEKCVRLTKSGGLIVVDNTLWGGMIAVPDDALASLVAKEYSDDDTSDDAMLARRAKDTIAIKALAVKIHNDPRIERVSFLTIADGVTICRKK